MMLHMQIAALLQEPYADLKPGGDVDAAQWKEVASLPAMKGGYPSFVLVQRHTHLIPAAVLLQDLWKPEGKHDFLEQASFGCLA